MQTKDITDENIAKLKALFPNAVTEIKDDDGNVREAIDFDIQRAFSHRLAQHDVPTAKTRQGFIER